MQIVLYRGNWGRGHCSLVTECEVLQSIAPLRWLNSLKNDDIHQKHEVFKSIMFKALEHLRKAFSSYLAEFPSR